MYTFYLICFRIDKLRFFLNVQTVDDKFPCSFFLPFFFLYRIQLVVSPPQLPVVYAKLITFRLNWSSLAHSDESGLYILSNPLLYKNIKQDNAGENKCSVCVCVGVAICIISVFSYSKVPKSKRKTF